MLPPAAFQATPATPACPTVRPITLEAMSTPRPEPATMPPPRAPAAAAVGPIVLVGGGGHALVVAEAAFEAGLAVAGFLDDNPAAPLGATLLGAAASASAPPSPKHLGTLRELDRIGPHAWVIALGDLRLRRGVLRQLAPTPTPSAVLVGGASAAHSGVVHPTASVSRSAVIGPGVYIGPNAVVHSRARVGAHAIINSGAIIEHDTVIEENAHVAPAAALGGGVRIGADTLVGLGARVLPGVAVGAHAVVGAGAVVTADVPEGRTVMGVPAR